MCLGHRDCTMAVPPDMVVECRDAIERLQNFDLGLYLTIFLSKYDYKEYRREAHNNLSSSIVRMHEGTIFDDY